MNPSSEFQIGCAQCMFLILKTTCLLYEKEGWGSKVLKRVAKDLQKECPGVEGFSRSNIFYIRSFYVAYSKVQQLVGQFETLPIFSIPWGHNVLLIQKIKDTNERLWYASKVIKHGWSRSVLTT